MRKELYITNFSTNNKKSAVSKNKISGTTDNNNLLLFALIGFSLFYFTRK